MTKSARARDADDTLEERHFAVTSVKKTNPPAGESGDKWYQYVIGQGESAITGKRAGTLRSVTEHAEEFAENLNRRASLGYSPYAARRQQQK